MTGTKWEEHLFPWKRLCGYTTRSRSAPWKYERLLLEGLDVLRSEE